jgi:hypothetical protein
MGAGGPTAACCTQEKKIKEKEFNSGAAMRSDWLQRM